MVVAIVAIVHWYKLESLKLTTAQRNNQDVERKIDAWHEEYQQFILGFDATLKRLESRIARLESERQQMIGDSEPSARFVPVEKAGNEEVQVGRAGR